MQPSPLIFNLGPTELIIILVIVLLLFGGSRLAGLGKSSGRALKEFKEETRGLRESSHREPDALGQTSSDTPRTYPPAAPQPPQGAYQGGQAQGYPPQGQGYDQSGAQQVPPANLADPSTPDSRRDA